MTKIKEFFKFMYLFKGGYSIIVSLIYLIGDQIDTVYR